MKQLFQSLRNKLFCAIYLLEFTEQDLVQYIVLLCTCHTQIGKFQEYLTAGIASLTTRHDGIEPPRFNLTDYEVTAICRYGIKRETL